MKKFHQGVNAVFNFIDDVEIYQVLRKARSFDPELDLIILTENGEVASLASAWFDEVLYSEKNGRLRGTGVLTLRFGEWKLEHYAMSFLIFNENWDEVIELTKRTRVLKEGGQE